MPVSRVKYVPDHYAPAGRRMREWLGGEGRLLVVEIGAGFSTPSVIRWSVESLVRSLPGARLVRINRDNAEVLSDLDALAVRADVSGVL